MNTYDSNSYYFDNLCSHLERRDVVDILQWADQYALKSKWFVYYEQRQTLWVSRIKAPDGNEHIMIFETNYNIWQYRGYFFNIKIPSYQYGDSHQHEKTVLGLFYLYNMTLCTSKNCPYILKKPRW